MIAVGIKIGNTTMSISVFHSFSSHRSFKLNAYRFVDRDMFMRYIGGGVGHKNYGALLKENNSYISADISESAQDAIILNEMEVEAIAAESSQNKKAKEVNVNDAEAEEPHSPQEGINELKDNDVNIQIDEDVNLSDDLASENDSLEDESESVFDFRRSTPQT